MEISSSPLNVGAAQTHAAQASLQIMQTANTMLIRQTSDIAEKAMDTLLGEMMPPLEHLGQNIDIKI